MCDGIVIIKCDVEISKCVLMFLKNICSILICKKGFFYVFLWIDILSILYDE